ncbi:MAG TPA: ATP-binding protein [Ohtaekwangia sp.]
MKRLPIWMSPKQRETEIAMRATEACEQIIAEMGAELHDDLIQKLSIFRLYIDRLERSVHDPVETQVLLTKMQTDFQEVVQSVRKISRQLMPVRMDDDSFQKGIEMLCQNMERGTEHVHFVATGTEQKISHQSETYLYRIVQELIHNAFKHSSAWHIWVRLSWSDGKLMIEVEDDGTGFHKIEEFIALLRKKHNTLRMRSQAIGASLKYSRGEKGLIARIEYPV